MPRGLLPQLGHTEGIGLPPEDAGKKGPGKPKAGEIGQEVSAIQTTNAIGIFWDWCGWAHLRSQRWGIRVGFPGMVA